MSIDTFWFNVIFIWILSVLMFAGLYYGIPERIMKIPSTLWDKVKT